MDKPWDEWEFEDWWNETEFVDGFNEAEAAWDCQQVVIDWQEKRIKELESLIKAIYDNFGI